MAHDRTIKIRPIILCGGFGRRLWPLSRPYWPKPFLDFGYEHTLLQQTVLRFQGDAFAPPIVICNEEHRFGVAQQLRDLHVSPETIILEPKSAGTAAAVMFGLHYLSTISDTSTLAITPADHIIDPIEDFQKAILSAAAATSDFDLVLLGAPANAPSTNYGYIKVPPDTRIQPNEVTRIARFVEKPPVETAKNLLSSGDAYWNTGIFLFDAVKMTNMAASIAPELASSSKEAVLSATSGDDFIRLERNAVERIQSKSFDIEIVEKCHNVGMAALPATWSDMGTWQSIWNAADKDDDGNAVVGKAILNGVKNSLVMSDNVNIAIGNVSGMSIISSGDSVFISPLTDSQMPAILLDMATQQGTITPSLTPSKLHRAWGTFEIIRNCDTFSIKQLTVTPGKRLSLQRHKYRSEHWVIISGQATITIGDEIKLLGPNESVYVPAGHLHRLANDAEDPLVVIEIQTGSYLGEDDIERLDDDFERSHSSHK